MAPTDSDLVVGDIAKAKLSLQPKMFDAACYAYGEAVFPCGQAQNMAGKMVGISFPISAFVAIGFDHIPADRFMVPLGLLAGAGASVLEMLYKNFLPYHA